MNTKIGLSIWKYDIYQTHLNSNLLHWLDDASSRKMLIQPSQFQKFGNEKQDHGDDLIVEGQYAGVLDVIDKIVLQTQFHIVRYPVPTLL